MSRRRPLYSRPEVPILNRDSPQARGLIGWWPTIGADKRDLAGGVNWSGAPALTGSEFGSVPLVSCSGGAYSLYVPSADAARFNESFAGYSVSCWTKSFSTPSGTSPFGRWAGTNGWMFFLNGTHDIRMYAGFDNTGAVDVSWENNRWYLLTATLASNGVSMDLNFYVNSVLKATKAVGSSADPAVNLQTGNYNNSQGSAYDGVATDFRFYNRPLSAQEVWSLYDPATRWDLYWQKTRTFFVIGNPVGPSSRANRLTLLGTS